MAKLQANPFVPVPQSPVRDLSALSRSRDISPDVSHISANTQDSGVGEWKQSSIKEVISPINIVPIKKESEAPEKKGPAKVDDDFIEFEVVNDEAVRISERTLNDSKGEP